MSQIEQRAERLVAFWREIAKGPVSAWTVGKRLGYRPQHAHRWVDPLLRERVVVRRKAGLVQVKVSTQESAARLARAAARSLRGLRPVRVADTLRAQDVVGQMLGVRLYDRPMTNFDD